MKAGVEGNSRVRKDGSDKIDWRRGGRRGTEGHTRPTNDGGGHKGKGLGSDGNAKRVRAAVLFGNEDGSGPEPYLGEELSGEHEITEGGEELTGAPAVRAVPEKDGFHGSISPSRSAGSSPRG